MKQYVRIGMRYNEEKVQWVQGLNATTAEKTLEESLRIQDLDINEWITDKHIDMVCLIIDYSTSLLTMLKELNNLRGYEVLPPELIYMVVLHCVINNEIVKIGFGIVHTEVQE